ncbi:hypothetical protein [Luteimonas abyssi]|uniref:hypothetical protein n=1 Tax=Luteimonas abyssi TaxID=1247514 RepID=UPI000737D6C4|nr:hypothetical protein [Luteimonas abyssi]
MRRLTASVVLCAALSFAGAASADVLLIDRVEAQSRTRLPAQGMRMADVEAHFGTPSEKLDPRGGQKRDWPAINRWVYPGFTVYFERERVVSAVLNQASPNETGPRPAIR